jgi:hypothetical protein
MSRRSRRRAAFSLFAFQDIVTAITAIMILLVLVLTLELLSRKCQEAAWNPNVARRDLIDTIDQFSALAANLRKTLADGESVGFHVAGAGAAITRELAVTQSQAEQALREARRASAAEQAAARAAAVARARANERRRELGDVVAVQEQAAEADADARRLALDNEQERDRLARKQEELKNRPRPGTELVFNAPPESRKQAWLVELSGEGVVVVKLGSGRQENLGPHAGPRSGMATWIGALRQDLDYALVLVRPSGVDAVADVRSLLEGRSIDHGIDFIGENQAVRDGTAASGDHVENGPDRTPL